jgi:hypothetical protein
MDANHIVTMALGLVQHWCVAITDVDPDIKERELTAGVTPGSPAIATKIEARDSVVFLMKGIQRRMSAGWSPTIHDRLSNLTENLSNPASH